MNIAGKYADNKLVGGINLDQIVAFQFDEKKGTLTLQMAGMEKDLVMAGAEAEGLYFMLNRSVIHNLTAKPYDWKAEMKSNRAKAEAELAAQEKAEQDRLKGGARPAGAPGSPAAISTPGLGGAAKPAAAKK